MTNKTQTPSVTDKIMENPDPNRDWQDHWEPRPHLWLTRPWRTQTPSLYTFDIIFFFMTYFICANSRCDVWTLPFLKAKLRSATLLSSFDRRKDTFSLSLQKPCFLSHSPDLGHCLISTLITSNRDLKPRWGCIPVCVVHAPRVRWEKQTIRQGSLEVY